MEGVGVKLSLSSAFKNLNSHFDTILQQAFPAALKLVYEETQLPPPTFSQECHYSAEQLLDEDFLP